MHSRMIGTVLTVVLVLSGVAAAKILYVDSEQAPTVPGTVAYWTMDDNAATKVVLDSGPNLLNGTSILRNTSAMSVEGKVGRALDFNGTGDCIDFGTNAKLLPDAWTFCAWIKTPNIGDLVKPQLVSFGGSYPGVKLQQDGGGKPRIFMGASNYREFDGSSWTTLKDGQWHFVVFSIPGKAQADIQNSKMYLDGEAVAVSSTVATGPQSAKSRFLIGNNVTTGLHRFKGVIDNAKLYNRALTDAEVQQIYASFTAGGNWSSAFNNIGEAITLSADNDEIWVKKGTFVLTQPLTVDKALKFYGGFAGTETDLAQRNIRLNPTTIDGNNAVYHCFQVTSDATIDGFTITRGKATGPLANDKIGGGILAKNCMVTVANCMIQNNTAASGAGAYLDNSPSLFESCTISGNQATANGGGVYNFGGDNGTIHNTFRTCRLAANTAGGKGGALFSTGGTLDHFNHPELANCIVVLNDAEDGGALYFDQFASGDILNCTITGNHAQRGGGMFVFESYSYPRVMNTILWGDSSVTGHPEIHFLPTGGTESYPENMALYYNDIMTGWNLNSVKVGNLILDPAFADPDGLDNNPATWEDNDYRILSTSPLIDKGISQFSALFAPVTDFLGTARPQDNGFDIGAFEYTTEQGLAFQADFDLDYSYTAPVRTQSFMASTQSCDVTWWLGLTNTSGGAIPWNLNSVTFETPNTLGNFFPTDPVISGNQYQWNTLTVADHTELEAMQTTVKKDAAIPFTVTRAFTGNTILGSGDMTTTVTVTPEAGLASFSVMIGVAPAWTEADWWNQQYIGTVQHLSAEVTGNTSGQLTHRNTPELQEYEWEFTDYTSGQPITFTVQTRVVLNSGIPNAYLEPIVTVSGNLTVDNGSEVWEDGTLTLPDNGRVILDGTTNMLILDGYLPWYELILPHYAKPITGDANNDSATNMLDLLILSENWLMPCDGANNFCDGADFDFNGKVDLTDFIFLSEFWLRNQDI